ncbi:PAS domain S-box protein [Algihabitans albus]|uniref:PAS domain S-box protein n=1 Tax=Algihabitans albus TaxID=2164067 RepID=UPI000E5D0CCA|nr:PAS domain S-box protein [Algihabitans albus]
MKTASEHDKPGETPLASDRTDMDRKDSRTRWATTHLVPSHSLAQMTRGRVEPWVYDLIGAFAVACLATAGLIALDAFEMLYELSRQHEDWELDELIIVVPVLCVVSAWFGWRRWRETGRHLRARIRMEEELRSNTEDLDFLISSAGGAFYSAKVRDGLAIVQVDPSIENQTGYRPEDFIGDSDFWSRMIHPDDRDRAAARLPELLEKDYDEQEYRFRHADGSYRWMLDQLRLKRTTDGLPDSIVGLYTDITERKEAEQALEAAIRTATAELRQREAHLRLITDNLPVLIVYEDLDLRYRFINQTGVDWFAQPRQQIIGRSISEVMGDESFGRIESYIESARQGVQSTFETTMAYPDGVTRDIHGLYLPDLDENGRVKGLVAMAMDITDRKRAENELRSKKNELELIFNHVPTRIFYKDDANRILRLNEPAARSMGMTVEEAEGADSFDLFPEMAKSYHDDDLEIIRSGTPKLGIIEEYVPRDGERGWVRTDKVPYTDPDTGRRFVFIATSDITAEKLAEEQLRAGEERYRSLYTRTPVMLHSIDAEGRLLSVSDFWLEKLGYSRDEVVGKQATNFMTPESAYRATAQALPELLRTGACKDLEYQIVTKSGEVLDILSSAVAEYDEAGDFSRSMEVLTDITKRKVVERQLVQAQKMESVGQLTGGLAHDFNNLLGIVMGNLELLEQSVAEDKDAERWIEAALAAVERGAELNRRLLAFSRRQTLETQSVDPNPLIEGLGTLLRRTLGESIAFEYRLGQQIPLVRSDPNQLESAILNLAVNARDAMPKGGRLTIETEHVHLDDDYASRESEVAPGDYVVLSVTDNGDGIPADEIDKVFEPFFTTKDVGKGSGLGLSMVYGFIKQSGGHVRVYSEVGVGTTVRLYLPVQDGGLDEAPTSILETTELESGQETVLVVEDQLEVRTVAVSLLRNLGYRVLEAESGPQALLILEEDREIDLLFTDIVMPGGMDGTQVGKAARKLRPDLPVVYATGYAEAAVLRQGEVTTAQNLVTKPYRRKELAHKIRQAFDEKRFQRRGKVVSASQI